MCSLILGTIIESYYIIYATYKFKRVTHRVRKHECQISRMRYIVKSLEKRAGDVFSIPTNETNSDCWHSFVRTLESNCLKRF